MYHLAKIGVLDRDAPGLGQEVSISAEYCTLVVEETYCARLLLHCWVSSQLSDSIEISSCVLTTGEEDGGRERVKGGGGVEKERERGKAGDPSAL